MVFDYRKLRGQIIEHFGTQKASSVDDRGRMTAAVTESLEAQECPKRSCTSTRRKDIYKDWLENRKEAEDFADEARSA